MSTPTIGTGIPKAATGGPRKNSGWWGSYDWILIASALSLSVLGSVLVWSATRPRLVAAGIDPQYYFKKHLLNLIIGLFLGFVASRIPFRTMRAWSWYLYLLSLFTLVVVISPLGSNVNGHSAWISLPAGFALQPAEFTKLALILVVANVLATKRDGETEPGMRQLVQVLVLVLVALGLIMLQPDVGTTVMICFSLLAMIAVSGIKARWIVLLVVAGVFGAVGAAQTGLLAKYQVDRFVAFANPSVDPLGVGYNTQQARTAIGAGRVFGAGLFQGNQTNGGFVPEQKTDFIFTVAGEELGFVGCTGIVVLLGLVLWRIIRIGGRSPDLYGRIVAAGVAGWFTFQAFENIGMNLGIMPVTGVPLPFVSYGGSSMFATWIAIGVLMAIYRARPAIQLPSGRPSAQSSVSAYSGS